MTQDPFPSLPVFPTEGAALRRVGVVDVGSNSVRLVVFDGAARSPAYFFNEKVLCGLGAGLAHSGRLNPEGWKKAVGAISRFTTLARRMKLTHLMGIATAAVREARDGPAFCDEIARRTGLRLRVATGQEEARLAAQGVLLGWPDAGGIIADIGGASMELARVEGGRIGTCVTSSLAPLPLRDLSAKGRRAHIASTLAALKTAVPGPVETLYLVGGSWRAIALLHMQRTDYPLPVLHAYEMEQAALLKTAGWLAGQDAQALLPLTSTSEARLELVPYAAQVLGPLIEAFAPTRIAISSYGLREGALYELMSRELRAKDPLLEACRYMEAQSARFPGFGDALYRWIAPLFTDEDADRHRLIRAACLLHDVHWRSHPDFRATINFEAITRANLGGVGHPGRIFLGLALAHRYKSGRSVRPPEPLLSLISREEQTLAEKVGRALRLGAMMSGAAVDVLADAELRLTATTLDLRLGEASAPLVGEAVSRRLTRLARAFKVEARLTVTPCPE
ncbi:MAG: Ppx/GppA family phosphatase [Pseudomonadota bacterium]